MGGHPPARVAGRGSVAWRIFGWYSSLVLINHISLRACEKGQGVTDTPETRSVLPPRGSTPTPISGAFCGLSGALSEMLTAAFRLPGAAGVNVTLMLQLPPAGTEVPQLSRSAKSILFDPVTMIDEILHRF